MANGEIHPDVQRAMKAISEPEVQEILQRLARFGLAIAVPHMPGDQGEFLPLPKDRVGFEAGLRVSFRDVNDPDVRKGIPVMWRWDEETCAAAKCYECHDSTCHFGPAKG